jgi:hypothetical protein
MVVEVSVARKKPHGFVLFVRRVFAHLTRSTAVWGYVLAAVCIVIYALIPRDWLIADAVRQSALILASVAIGAIVLPELPSNLWSFDAEKVRNLIPADRREGLAKSLIRAETEDERWNDLVWEKALQPLLTASREPWRYVKDMDYEIAVHLNRHLDVGGTTVNVHSVQSEQKSMRMLARPGLKQVSFSIARTQAALEAEFSQRGCLARELVPLGELSGAHWQDAVREVCRVEFSVDGVALDLEAVADPELPDVVRWYSSSDYDLPTNWVKVGIGFDFHVSPSIDNFPVFFSGYYCAGTTDVSLKLHDGLLPSDLDCDYFVAHALEDEARPRTRSFENSIYRKISFSTGRDAILWPGSGVRFSWKPRS